MPDFPNDQHIFLHSLYCLSEILPEEMADFVSYIQSPSVNIAFLNPVACNIRNVFSTSGFFRFNFGIPP